jgi:hypothetical protein
MKQSLIKLLAESTLIVFSVLLAFWIDKKNQSSDDDELRSELLQRVYVDIQNDSLTYSGWLHDRQEVTTNLNLLIDYSNSSHIDIDSLTNLSWHRSITFCFIGEII